MSETDDKTRIGREDGERRTDCDDGDRPAVACTLTGERRARRGEWIREALVPHLTAVEDRDDGVSLVFDRSAESHAAAAELARRESRCCSWAAFAVELPPGGDVVEWRARSEREAGVEFLREGLREALSAFEDAPDPN